MTYNTTNLIKRYHTIEHEDFLGRRQRGERSQQEPLLELFKQGKLPADNGKAKAITEKLLKVMILDSIFSGGKCGFPRPD